MLADPRQAKNIANQHPDVLGILTAVYADWYRNVTRSGFDPILGGPCRLDFEYDTPP